jgi:hypothetical protein
MSLYNMQSISFFGVPEGNEAILVSRDYLTTLISP